MSKPEIAALIFDVFGSVVDWRTSVAREAEAILAPKGHDLDWIDFAVRWRKRYQPAMEEVRSGRRPWTKLDDLHRENLLAILEELAVEGLPEDEIDHLNRAWHRLSPWPDSVEGLTRLKTKFIIAPHSNGNLALMVNMAKNAGLPWDAILGAEVCKAYKPKPESYLRACDFLGLPPERVMMSAAHNGDLLAASKQGLRTAFWPRPTEHGEGQATDTEAKHDFDYVATDLIDLADQLGCGKT